MLGSIEMMLGVFHFCAALPLAAVAMTSFHSLLGVLWVVLAKGRHAAWATGLATEMAFVRECVAWAAVPELHIPDWCPQPSWHKHKYLLMSAPAVLLLPLFSASWEARFQLPSRLTRVRSHPNQDTGMHGKRTSFIAHV